MPSVITASTSSRVRQGAASQWLAARHRTEVLIVAPTRSAADDLVRVTAQAAGGLLGAHRITLLSLASDIAAGGLAESQLAPVSRLGAEALAARAVHACRKETPLEYFEPVADRPGMRRALARTITELRIESVPAAALDLGGAPGRDMRRLLSRYDVELERAMLADAAEIFAHAARLAATVQHRLLGVPVLLYDVRPCSRRERAFVEAVASRAPEVFATTQRSDALGVESLEAALGVSATDVDAAPTSALDRVRARIFSSADVEAEAGDDSVRFFSAPNEARECVEIARRIAAMTRDGVPFDRMAVLLRSPHAYQPLVEDALRRAKIPAYYGRGTARPNPGGRALLALLDCAAERFSASRFAEYLSLGQVPAVDDTGAPPAVEVPWVAPSSEEQLVFQSMPRVVEVEPLETDEAPVLAGTLRVPRQWERMIVDAAVIGGRDRWARRLAGLERELAMRIAELEAEGSERAESRRLDLARLENLRRFCLPIIDFLAVLPDGGRWGDWLDALERLATMALASPEPVLGVLAELRPMRDVGPVSLDDARQVLGDRLGTLRQDPPKRRYGRVFVGAIGEAAGRAFDVVFVPGLAEGVFPRKSFEDPLLLDASRIAVDGVLATQPDRFAEERALLRMVASAAGDVLIASYPRTDVARGRPRVPSFYALDLLRAAEGDLPDLAELEHRATMASGGRVGWPAPRLAEDAIDDAEFDLATLLEVMSDPGVESKGACAYLKDESPTLDRALRARWHRWKYRWSPFDGLNDQSDATIAALAKQRLRARSYSPTALQNYADCPYKFFLQAVLRVRSRDEIEVFEQMDALTRGSLFHAVQHRLITKLRDGGWLPITAAKLPVIQNIATAVLDEVAGEEHDALAPAVERVWTEAIDGIRNDLRGWLDRVADDVEWTPSLTEFGFGLPRGQGGEHDAATRADPAKILDGVLVRGSIDLVEVRTDGTGKLRVTDHKTGRQRSHKGMIVGGGKHLQPLIYALAADALLDGAVEVGRLYYCTEKGGYTPVDFPNDAYASEQLGKVVNTIDDAVASGFLPAAPDDGACRWCDYRAVCGPYEENRTRRKSRDELTGLVKLRGLE